MVVKLLMIILKNKKEKIVMRLDISLIKWREEINEKFSKEINKTLCEEINNRWNELEYTWYVNTPTVDTTSTTNYYTYDGGMVETSIG